MRISRCGWEIPKNKIFRIQTRPFPVADHIGRGAWFMMDSTQQKHPSSHGSPQKEAYFHGTHSSERPGPGAPPGRLLCPDALLCYSFAKISPDMILGYGVRNNAFLFDMKLASPYISSWQHTHTNSSSPLPRPAHQSSRTDRTSRKYKSHPGYHLELSGGLLLPL